jgi:hypothetical protein
MGITVQQEENPVCIIDYLSRLCSAMSVFWPPRAIRMMRLGAQRIAEFRNEHGREPTEQEWKQISWRVYEEVTGRG